MKPIVRQDQRSVNSRNDKTTVNKQDNNDLDAYLETLLDTIAPSYQQQLQFTDTELEALLDSFAPFYKKLDEHEQEKIAEFYQKALYDLETLVPSYRNLDELHQKIIASNYLNIISAQQESNRLLNKHIEACVSKIVVGQSEQIPEGQQETSIQQDTVERKNKTSPYILDIDIDFLNQKVIHTHHIHDKATGEIVASITYLNGTLIINGYNSLALNIKGGHVLDNCFIDNQKSSIDILNCDIKTRDFFHLHASSLNINKGAKISGQNILIETKNKIEVSADTVIHADKALMIFGKDLYCYGKLYSNGSISVLTEKNIYFPYGSNCEAKNILSLSSEKHYYHDKLRAKQLQIASSKYCIFVAREDPASRADLSAEDHILITGHKVICDAKIDSDNEFYLKTSGDSIFSRKAHVKSKQIQINVDKKLTLEKTAKLSAGSTAQINSENLQITDTGSIVSEGQLLVKTSNTFSLEKTGELSAGSFLQITGRLLKIENKIQSGGQLTVYTSSLNLERNSNINANQTIDIIASRVFSRGKIKSDNHCQVIIVNKLLAEQGSHWASKNGLTIEAKSCKIYGNLTSEKSDLKISIDEDCTFYKNVECNAGRNIIIIADNLWSSAILCAKEHVNIGVNKYFIHGLTGISLRSVKDDAFKACIRGKHVNIVTSVYASLLNFISAKNFNLACLFELSAGSVIYATHNNNNHLIRFGIHNLDLPNLIKECEGIYNAGIKGADYIKERLLALKKINFKVPNSNDLFSVIRHIQRFDFNQISYLDWFSSGGANVIVKFIGLLVPEVKNFVDIIYNSACLIANYNKIKHDISELMIRRQECMLNEMQLRDIIPIIVQSKNIMMQVKHNLLLFEAFAKDNLMPRAQKYIKPYTDDLEPIIEKYFTPFGENYLRPTANFLQSMDESFFKNIEECFTPIIGQYTQLKPIIDLNNYMNEEFFNQFAPDYIEIVKERLKQIINLDSHDDYREIIGKSGETEQEQKSVDIFKERLKVAFMGATATALSPLLPSKTQSGILDYSSGIDLAVNINEQSLYSYNAKHQIAYMLNETFRKAYFSGKKLTAHGSFQGRSVTVAERMHFQQSLYISLLENMTQIVDSVITANNAYVQAKNNYLQGKQEYSKNSKIKYEQQVVGEDGEFNLSQSTAEIGTQHVAGTTHITDNSGQMSQNMEIEPTGDVNVTESGLRVDGELKQKSKSNLHVSDRASIGVNMHVIEEDGEFNLRASTAEIDTQHVAGTTHITDNSGQMSQNMEIEPTGDVHVTQAGLRVDGELKQKSNSNLNGSDESYVEINKHMIDEDGKFNLNESTAKINTQQVAGTTHITDKSIQISQDLDIKSTGDVNVVQNSMLEVQGSLQHQGTLNAEKGSNLKINKHIYKEGFKLILDGIEQTSPIETAVSDETVDPTLETAQNDENNEDHQIQSYQNINESEVSKSDGSANLTEDHQIISTQQTDPNLDINDLIRSSDQKIKDLEQWNNQEIEKLKDEFEQDKKELNEQLSTLTQTYKDQFNNKPNRREKNKLKQEYLDEANNIQNRLSILEQLYDEKEQVQKQFYNLKRKDLKQEIWTRFLDILPQNENSEQDTNVQQPSAFKMRIELRKLSKQNKIFLIKLLDEWLAEQKQGSIEHEAELDQLYSNIKSAIIGGYIQDKRNIPEKVKLLLSERDEQQHPNENQTSNTDAVECSNQENTSENHLVEFQELDASQDECDEKTKSTELTEIIPTIYEADYVQFEGQGEIKLSNAIMNFHQDTLDLNPQLRFTTHNATINCENINYHALAENSGYFKLNAVNVLNTSEDSEMNGGAIFLISERGDPLGKMNCESIFIQNNQLVDPNGLLAGIGPYAGQHHASRHFNVESQQDIQLIYDIERDCGIHAIAPSIYGSANLTSHNGGIFLWSTRTDLYLTGNLYAKQNNVHLKAERDVITERNQGYAGDQYIIDAGRRYLNIQGHHSGQELYAISRTGDIVNARGTLEGRTYSEAIAKGIVMNLCMEHIIQGRYDERVKYNPACILGGDGTGQNGIGVNIQAEKVINDASYIMSTGSNYVSGKMDVDFRERHDSFVSKDKTKHSLFGKKKTKQTDHEIQTAHIISECGKNLITSELGMLKSYGGNMLAAEGNLLYAQDGHELHDVITHSTSNKKSKYLFGLIGRSKSAKHEHATPTLIASHTGDIQVVTEKDIRAHGAVVLTPGDVYLKGYNVVFSLSTLNHSVKEKQRNISFSMFGTRFIESMSQGDSFLRSLSYEDQLLSRLRDIRYSQNTAEYIANGWNLGIEGFNTLHSISYGLQNNCLTGEFLQRTGLGDVNGFNPRMTLTNSLTASKYKYQTLGEGGIHSGGNCYVDAVGEFALMNGVPVYVDHDMHINASRIYQQGARLDSRYECMNHSVGISFNPITRDTEVSASRSRYQQKHIHYENQRLYVGRKLTVNADEWILDAANADFEKIDGNCKLMVINDRQGTQTNKSESYSVGSDGNVAVDVGSGKSAMVNQRSGLHGRNGINDGEEDFNVGRTVSHGGGVTSDGQNNFKSGSLEGRAIKDFNVSSHFGLQGNIKTLLPKETPDAEHLPNSQTKPLSTTPIPVANVSYGYRNYQAIQTPTFYGSQGTMIDCPQQVGTLNTTSMNSTDVSHDQQLDLKISIPILDRQRLKNAVHTIRRQGETIYFPPQSAENAENIKPVVIESSVHREELNANFEIDTFEVEEQSPNSSQSVVDSESEDDIPPLVATNELLLSSDEGSGTAELLHCMADGLKLTQKFLLPSYCKIITTPVKFALKMGSNLSHETEHNNPDAFRDAAIHTGVDMGCSYFMFKFIPSKAFFPIFILYKAGRWYDAQGFMEMPLGWTIPPEINDEYQAIRDGTSDLSILQQMGIRSIVRDSYEIESHQKIAIYFSRLIDAPKKWITDKIISLSSESVTHVNSQENQMSEESPTLERESILVPEYKQLDSSQHRFFSDNTQPSPTKKPTFGYGIFDGPLLLHPPDEGHIHCESENEHTISQ